MVEPSRLLPANLLNKRFLAYVPESVYRDSENNPSPHNQGNKFLSLLLKKVQGGVQLLQKKTIEKPEEQTKEKTETKSTILNIKGAVRVSKNFKPKASECFVDKKAQPGSSLVQSQAAIELNAAAWLRFHEVPDKQISLLVVYEDSEGKHAVIADESTASTDGQVMLSGKISIESKGKLRQMSLFCGGLDKETKVVVDELHVQKVKQYSGSDKPSMVDLSTDKDPLKHTRVENVRSSATSK